MERFYELWQTPGSPAFSNATEAYRRSYDVSRMKETSIARQAHTLTLHPKIAARLKSTQAATAQSVTMDRIGVMRHLVDLAEADPTKVVILRRLCCRHCHGITHAFQWRDEAEYYEAVAATMDRNARRHAKAAARKQAVEDEEPIPTNEGGYGWRRPNKPAPGCPKCFGEGTEDVFIPDFETLAPRERRLIAAVKQTKDGVEVKMRDQDGALTTIAQILKMLVNKTELTGENGGPLQMAVLAAVLPVDDVQASQAYQRMMDGKA